jgi:hypothetical protein
MPTSRDLLAPTSWLVFKNISSLVLSWKREIAHSKRWMLTLIYRRAGASNTIHRLALILKEQTIGQSAIPTPPARTQIHGALVSLTAGAFM